MKMSYHERLQEIRRNFVMRYQDRQTCMTLFEQILWEYGMLPKEEEMDRSISDDNFLGLIKMALAHKDVHSNRDHEVSKDRSYPPQRCPLCSKQVRQLVGSVQDHRQIHALKPPRCESCAVRWMEENILHYSVGSGVPKGDEFFTPDATACTPLRKDEAAFFDGYEKEMKNFKP